MAMEVSTLTLIKFTLLISLHFIFFALQKKTFLPPFWLAFNFTFHSEFSLLFLFIFFARVAKEPGKLFNVARLLQLI